MIVGAVWKKLISKYEACTKGASTLLHMDIVSSPIQVSVAFTFYRYIVLSFFVVISNDFLSHLQRF